MLIKNLSSKAEAQATAKLYCQIWKEPPWNEDFWDPNEVVKDIQKQITKLNAIFLIAINGASEVLSFTWGYQVNINELSKISGVETEIWQKIVGNSNVFYIDEFGTQKKHRKQGIGTKLAKELLKQLSKTDMDLVTLRTDKSAVPARTVYSQLGFKEIGIQDAKYKNRTYWLKFCK